MPSDARKKELAEEAKNDMKRRFWKDDVPLGFASIVDDIRVKVIEQGWYGSQLYNMRDGLEQTMYERFYGKSNEANAQDKDAFHQRQQQRDLEQDR